MSINNSDFEYIKKLVKNKSGVSLTDDKHYLVESRLLSIAKEIKVNNVSNLIAHLRKDSFNNLHWQVVEAMMTTETMFFRDKLPFDCLKLSILPELIEKRKIERSLNIWSAACSTGQEPYSIAILAYENFPQLQTWNFSIIASDISHQNLKRASNGYYNIHQINRGLSNSIHQKYFKKQGQEWQIIKLIRKKVKFIHLNLLENWYCIPKMDIIFLRNVLIYFDVEQKQEIFTKIKQVLRNDGYLFLGGGETTINIDNDFQPVKLNNTICYQLK